MPLNSERAQAIDAYIAANLTCMVNEKWPMEFGGKIDYEPVYHIPIKLLCYNLHNGRYALELAREEADAGIQFDPTRPQDHVKLRDLLLKLDPEQTALLKQEPGRPRPNLPRRHHPRRVRNQRESPHGNT